MPAAADTPWPREPVDMSTPGVSFMLGCPWRRLPMWRRVFSSSQGKKPFRARAAYRPGAVCPLERTKRSRSSQLGVGGVHLHLPEVQIGKQVRGGQASAGMAGFGAIGGFDDAHAHLAGVGHQLLFLTGCHDVLLLLRFPVAGPSLSSRGRSVSMRIIKQSFQKCKGPSAYFP